MTETTLQAPAEDAGFYDWLPHGFTVHEVDTNGVRISTAVGGAGPTVVLLHGWPQTSRTWRHVMPRLAEQYTVVAPDLRGAGASQRPNDGYSKTNQAKDMRGLLRSLGLHGPSAVVGHDIGAMVALAWAAKFPEDVSALVVLDAALPGLGLEELMNVAEGGMWHFGFFMAPHVPEMLFDGHEGEFFSSSFRALGSSGTFTDADLEFYARAYTGRDRLRGGFAQYRTLLQDGKENRELLQRHLPMPVLAVGGATGQGTALGESLAPYADQVTTIVAPASHFIQEEVPDWLLATLADFLTTSDPN